MTEKEFAFFEELLRREAGVVLTPEKTYLLESRLLPVALAAGLADVAALAKRLQTGDDGALCRLVVEAMMTSETFFFRDHTPFVRLREEVLPRLIQARQKSGAHTLRLWSAACASGQEPYSLAMILKEYGAPLEGWPVEIIATDVSHSLLAQAQKGAYRQFDVQRGLPVQMLVKYFSQEDCQWQIDDALKNMVSFRPQNMLHTPYHLGQFDIIFCRNVLAYFDAETKMRVLKALALALKPDGVLFLGGTETIAEPCDCFELHDDGTAAYRLRA